MLNKATQSTAQHLGHFKEELRSCLRPAKFPRNFQKQKSDELRSKCIKQRELTIINGCTSTNQKNRGKNREKTARSETKITLASLPPKTNPNQHHVWVTFVKYGLPSISCTRLLARRRVEPSSPLGGHSSDAISSVSVQR